MLRFVFFLPFAFCQFSPFGQSPSRKKELKDKLADGDFQGLHALTGGPTFAPVEYETPQPVLDSKKKLCPDERTPSVVKRRLGCTISDIFGQGEKKKHGDKGDFVPPVGKEIQGWDEESEEGETKQSDLPWNGEETDTGGAGDLLAGGASGDAVEEVEDGDLPWNGETSAGAGGIPGSDAPQAEDPNAPSEEDLPWNGAEDKKDLPLPGAGGDETPEARPTDLPWDGGD